MEYGLIDADGHYYEPDDCFSRHIESRFADRTIRVERGTDGLGRIFLRGQRTFMSVMPGDYASAPGALQGLFVGGVADGFTHREVVTSKDHPEFAERGARLAVLDRQGVDATIMLPTLGVAVEYDLRDDIELTYASLRAFNRWLEEDWGYGADGRLFGVPMLSLLDIDQAVRELHRVLDAGARMVHLCPGPIAGRSPADPIFDPFWATVSDAGIPVAFHVSNSGYQHFYGTHWSENPDNPSHQQSPLQWALCNTERPVVDTLIALTLHNLFGRHPGVKIVSIENGSNWLRPLFKTIDKAAALGRRGPMIGGKLPPRPSEALAEHLWVCPFPEDDVHDLIDAIGADHVLFGSDFPHPEGLREPRDYLPRLETCDPDVRHQVLRGNTAGLLGLN
ncbi:MULTISPECIES: amidohydrolase family protein [Nocardia]|uniref:amidohydrolase family protein n=1 Tax=Nocardia TaxID=1817 RepID=UPI0007EA5AF3|nr:MULTISPECIES: amidohydrolase family protein [Nocardia]MBF6273634.1 amidohydrolase [Nocardia nova]OBA55197.1 amidohydrolase [Nocardia sp. 852002-51101_SCH5132738]OBB36976.1 amidohydrolase [Nocardia sp. 852002-51244_SCH5132740]OBF74058.1 amidohydrolase [Mycobacterium sp. 852002-51759_SCH5129042]